MKRIIAVLLTVVMLAGCSSGVSQAEYDKLKADYDIVVAERDKLNKSQSSSSQVSQPISPPTLNKDIMFDEKNTATLMIFEDEKPTRGSMLCSFDGKDAKAEYVRIMASVFFFTQMDIGDYMVASTVSDDETQATVITCKNGEMQPSILMSEQYKALAAKGNDPELNQLVFEEYGKILKQVGNDTEVNNESTEQTSRGIEDTLIHDDQYVTIQYLGCEQDERGEGNIVFRVENKTTVELVFQSGTMAIDGVSLGRIGGSDKIAAKSTGKIRFRPAEELHTLTPQKISGGIDVIDFGKTVIPKSSYDVSFVDVEIK